MNVFNKHPFTIYSEWLLGERNAISARSMIDDYINQLKQQKQSEQEITNAIKLKHSIT